MNVLLLTPFFPPDTGGAATAFHLLWSGLCEDLTVRKAIVLCEMAGTWPTIEQIHRKSTVMRFVPRLGRVPGYDMRSAVFKTFLVIRRSLALLFLLPLLSRLFKIDVIHFHSTFGHIRGKYRNRLLEWALRLSRGRKICDVQDRRCKALHNQLADCFIANSMEIRRDLQERDGSGIARIEYLPVPIDPRMGRGGLVASEVPDGMNLPESFFSFIGDLSAPKGIYPLLEAHRNLLRSSDYPLSLVLVGRDRLGGRLAGHLNERTRWLGTLPHEKVLRIIGRSRFLIVSSFSEGIPRVCLEALAMGTPIVYPPGIEEFRRRLPEYMLPEIDAENIERMIRKMLSGIHRQDYPIRLHDASMHYCRIRSLYKGASAGS